MENTYNVKLSFKGEGNFTFTLPGYGDLTVYAGKDIFVKGLSVSGIELLRQLRPLKLEHQLNAKPDGCYRVIDLVKVVPVKPVFERAYKEPAPATVADLKSSLIKTTGPIIEEEPKTEEIKPEVEEVKSEEAKPEEVKKEEPKVEAPKANKPAPRNTNKSKAKSGKKKNSKK